MKANITSIEYKNMMLNASSLLQKNKDYVDSLNVFPVPDGDTGTNMNLTMQSVVREMEAAEDSMEGISGAIAVGSLKGARGNSGVILSQILKGFSNETAKVNAIDVETMKKALAAASDLAFKAVMKPKEGTILTVCRELAAAAQRVETNDLVAFLEYVVEQGKIMLAKTPDMLPVLKEAGVVDSGGTGLIVIFTGILNYLKGVDVDIDFAVSTPKSSGGVPKLEYDFSDEHIHSKYSYCTEFLINGVQDSEGKPKLQKKLEKIGDCVLVVGDGEILKVHVHTDNPDQALANALKLGYLNDIKIENMDEQRKKTKKQPTSPRKSIALVTVSVGKGVNEVFKQLLADVIIEGGQSMNPSIEDVLKAIDSVRSENVIILPNNKNIFLACDQAAEVSKKNVKVINTKSIPQGISAAMVFNTDASLEENVKHMNEAIEEVHCIQITKAVRTTKLHELEIKEGNYIAVVDGDIKIAGEDMESVIFDSFTEKGIAITDQAITLFYGDNVTAAEAEALAEKLEAAHPDAEVDAEFGGQPLYPYLISVE